MTERSHQGDDQRPPPQPRGGGEPAGSETAGSPGGGSQAGGPPPWSPDQRGSSREGTPPEEERPSAPSAPPGAAGPPSGESAGSPSGAAPPWWPGGSGGGVEPPDSGDYPEPEPVHRLSPLTLVTEPIRYLRNFLVPVAIALFFGTTNPVILASALVALFAMVVGGIVTYQTFRYQVGSERLEIRRGLLNRSHRTIPLERIRGVDVTSTLIHRMLGLAVVKVEAAAGGGAAEEGKLDAVSQHEAERLRRVLLHRRAVLQGEETGEGAAARETVTEPAPQETVYFTMPPRWYFYAVLSLGYLLTPFAALAAVLGFLSQVLNDLRGSVVTEDDARGIVEFFRDGGEFPVVTAIVVAVVVMLVLMPVFAVISYSINHWGFTLRRRDSSLVAERGLFTRQSVTLELRRVRGYEVIDNPLERLARAARLRAIVTGLGETATRAALLPIGARTRVTEVIAQALTLFRGELRAHPRAARSRRLFRAVAPFLVLALAAAALGFTLLAVVAFALALLGIPLGLDRYRSLGHGYDGSQISFRSGSLNRRQAVVSRSAIIGWRWSQTIFQRRVGLATLEASVGAGSGGYAALDMDFAGSVDFVRGVTPDMVRPFLVPETPAEKAKP